LGGISTFFNPAKEAKMGTLIFIIMGIITGLGIALLITQGLREAGYAVCGIFLLILLGHWGRVPPGHQESTAH
jgi:hypothetical protein